MSKLYLQEKIVGNPGQILTINNSNQLSLTEYKPALNSVIKVNGPINATIYASYLESSSDLVPLSIKGILKYDHEYSAKATNNVSSVSVNLDTWMTTAYANNYQNVFTYTSGQWKNSSSQNVNLTNLGISYELSSGSNPISGTTITITVDYDKARYEIYPPNAGTWTIACKTGTGYSETTQVVEANHTYEIDMSIFQAFIGVTYTVGATCKVINEEHGLTITAPNDDGYNIFTVPYPGLWEIEVTLTAQSASTGEDFVKEKHEYVKVTTLNQQLSRTVNIISSILNECTWDEIRYVADQHMGPYYWSIGDCKAITLNGPLYNPLKRYVSGSTAAIWTPSSVVFKNYYIYAFIIGFDHNAEAEGSGITFQLGKLDTSEELSGLNWKNNHRRNSKSTENSRAGYNQFYYSIAPWATSLLRTANLGSVSKEPYENQITPPNTSDIPTGYDGTQGYLGNSIMALIPSDLRDCLKSVKKYTNNNTVYAYSDGGWLGSYRVLVNNSAANNSLNITLDSSVYKASYLGTAMFTTFTCQSVTTYSGEGYEDYVYTSSWRIDGAYPDGTKCTYDSMGSSATGDHGTLYTSFGISMNYNHGVGPRVGDSFIIYRYLNTETTVNNEQVPIVSQTDEYIFLPSNYEVLGDDAIPDEITRLGFGYDKVNYHEFCEYQPPQYTLTTTGSGFSATLNSNAWSKGNYGSRYYTNFTYKGSQSRWECGNKTYTAVEIQSLGITVQGTPVNGSEITVTSPKTFVCTGIDYIKINGFNETLWNNATFTYNGVTRHFSDLDSCVFSYINASQGWRLNYYEGASVRVTAQITVGDLSLIGIDWEATTTDAPYGSSRIVVTATNSAGSFVPNGKQVQYEYFTNPANRLRYYYTGGTDEDAPNYSVGSNGVSYDTMAWYTRSPSHGSGTSNVGIAQGCINSATELSTGIGQSENVMLCPCFVVGSEDPAS